MIKRNFLKLMPLIAISCVISSSFAMQEVNELKGNLFADAPLQNAQPQEGMGVQQVIAVDQAPQGGFIESIKKTGIQLKRFLQERTPAFKLGQAQAQLEQSSLVIVNLQNQMQQLTQEAKIYQVQISALEETKKNQQAQYAALQNQTTATQNEFQKLLLDGRQTQAKLQETQERLLELTEKEGELKLQLQQEKVNSQGLQTQLQQTQEKLSQCQTDCIEFRNASFLSAEHINRYSNENVQLEAQIDQLINQSKIKNEEFLAQIQAMQQEKAAAEDQSQKQQLEFATQHQQFVEQAQKEKLEFLFQIQLLQQEKAAVEDQSQNQQLEFATQLHQQVEQAQQEKQALQLELRQTKNIAKCEQIQQKANLLKRLVGAQRLGLNQCLSQKDHQQLASIQQGFKTKQERINALKRDILIDKIRVAARKGIGSGGLFRDVWLINEQ